MKYCSLSLFLAISLSFSTPSHAAKAIQKFGAWSVFKAKEQNSLTCWIATARSFPMPGAKIQFYVTKREGKRAEVSILSSSTIHKTKKIALVIDGSEFRLYPRGKSAWVKPGEDAKVIGALSAAEKSKSKEIHLIWKGTQKLPVATDGFTKAYHKVIPNCHSE